jgi:hypothetical protein
VWHTPRYFGRQNEACLYYRLAVDELPLRARDDRRT